MGGVQTPPKNVHALNVGFTLVLDSTQFPSLQRELDITMDFNEAKGREYGPVKAVAVACRGVNV